MAYGRIWFTFLFVFLLSACQIDLRGAPTAAPTNTVAPTPTSTLSPTLSPTSTPTLTPTVTPSPTPTPSPTNTPTPTPVPSDRLALAQRAYTNGDYDTARRQFAALLVDSGADPQEKRLALHWRGRSELQLSDTSAAIATLKLFLNQYPSDELTRAAQFNLGLAYEQAGQSKEAGLAYLGSLIPHDPANVYIYERLGDLALQAQNYPGAIEAYQAGLKAATAPGFQVHLRESLAQVELARGQPKAAIAHYEAILSISKIEAYRAKILRLLGQTYLAAGQPEAAYQRYLEAVNRYPAAADSYLALVELVNAQAPVDEYQRGLVDYYAASYEAASAAFERYLTEESGSVGRGETKQGNSGETITQTVTLTTTLPISATAPIKPLPHAADAIWYTALSWQQLGRYNNALQFFQTLIDQYPAYPNWGQAHLELGQTLADQNNLSQAKATYRDFAAKNPQHPLATEALWRAARLELDNDLPDEAHASLLALVKAYPASDYAADALYWAGQAAFKLGRDDEAIADWAKLVNTYPASDLVSFAGYWQAKLLLKQGRDEEAKQGLTRLSRRSDYYGLRAHDVLNGVSPESQAVTTLTLPDAAQLSAEQVKAEAWLADWLELANRKNLSALSAEAQAAPAFQRGDALLKLGLRADALVEFETVKDSWWDKPLVLYQLSLYFRDKGLGRLSLVTAGRLIALSPGGPEAAPLFIQRLFYPVYFADVIQAEAKSHHLDPTLLLAVMRQESLFEPSAHSPAGARGLMQVMPATGDYIAPRAGFDSFEARQLWLPYVNIKFGAWYVNQQLGLFDNNVLAALAAYNAGPGYVLEWVKPSPDPDIFVESVPFRESRTYMRNVYVNLSAYRRLYGQPR